MGLNFTCPEDFERGFDYLTECVKNKTYSLKETIDLDAMALTNQISFQSDSIDQKLWKSSIVHYIIKNGNVSHLGLFRANQQ